MTNFFCPKCKEAFSDENKAKSHRCDIARLCTLDLAPFTERQMQMDGRQRRGAVELAFWRGHQAGQEDEARRHRKSARKPR